MKWLLLFLAVPSWSDTPVPFFPRTFDNNQSMGAINQNLGDITGRNRDTLVPVVGDQACAPGQALTGATEKGGYIFGGSCTSLSTGNITTTGSNSFTSSNTFTSGSTVTVNGFGNIPIFLSSQAFSGVTSSTFSVNAPTGAVITCEVAALHAGTNGTLQLTFNGRRTTNYNSVNVNIESNQGNDTSAFILMTYSQTRTGHLSWAKWTQFQGVPGAVELPVVGTFMANTTVAGTNDVGTFGGYWKENASAQTAAVEASTGTITGTVRCNYEKY